MHDSLNFAAALPSYTNAADDATCTYETFTFSAPFGATCNSLVIPRLTRAEHLEFYRGVLADALPGQGVER